MVKCADCGFLALRAYFTQELGSAPRRYREEGTFPVEPNNQRHSFERLPVCIMARRNYFDALRERALQNHVGFSPPDSVTSDEVHGILAEEYVCGEFTPWQEGFTPKEHREMIDRALLRKVDDEKEKERRTFEAGLMERAQEPQKALVRIATGALAVAGIGAVVTGYAAFTDSKGVTNHYYGATPTTQSALRP